MSDDATAPRSTFAVGRGIIGIVFAVPLTQIGNIAVLAHLTSQGYNWNPAGVPGLILQEYVSFRDFVFGTLAEVFPGAVILSPIQDLMFIWLLTGSSIYALYFGTNYPTLIEEIRKYKESKITGDRVEPIERLERARERFSDASYLLHYPWILKSFWILVALGPLIGFILLYKVLNPSFLVETDEAKETITRCLRRDTLIVWSALSLTVLGTAAAFWMDALSNVARASQ